MTDKDTPIADEAMDLGDMTHAIVDQARWFGISYAPVYIEFPDGSTRPVKAISRKHAVMRDGGLQDEVRILVDGRTGRQGD